MYRLQQQKMAATEGEQQVVFPESQFVSRVGQLPIVTSTMEHLLNIYQSTKESNNLLKYTLETAETGVKTVVTTTLPLVATPVNKLDEIACGQLDKLEQKYPIISKPTEQWVAGGKSLYEANMKPSVDKVVAVKDYGVDTVTGVKQYGYKKANDVKQLGVSTVTSVTHYGSEKVQGALQTPYGRQVSSGLNRVLDITESYIDYYLPEEEKAAEEATEKAAESENNTEKTEEKEDAGLTRIVTVTDKARRRMYSRAIRELKSVQLRTRESLEHLTFTVDLIQYAKTNMGDVQAKVTAVPSKLKSVWDEINMDEEQVETQELSTVEKSGVSNTTFERRAIATARHMTLKLKRGVGSLSASVAILPVSMRQRVGDMKAYTEELYHSFATAENFKDLPSRLLDQTRAQAVHIQETLDFLLDYIQTTRIASWMKLRQAKDDTEEIEMEPMISVERTTPDDETVSNEAGEVTGVPEEQSPSEVAPTTTPEKQEETSVDADDDDLQESFATSDKKQEETSVTADDDNLQKSFATSGEKQEETSVVADDDDLRESYAKSGEEDDYSSYDDIY